MIERNAYYYDDSIESWKAMRRARVGEGSRLLVVGASGGCGGPSGEGAVVTAAVAEYGPRPAPG